VNKFYNCVSVIVNAIVVVRIDQSQSNVWYILRIRFSALAMNIGTHNISRRSYTTVS